MRILILELHHLGDAIMSLPFVRGAREAHEVHVVCRPPVAEIYQWMGEKIHVHAWNPPWHEETARWISQCGSTLAFARTLRDIKADAAVCVWPDPRTQAIMRMAQIPVRVGLPVIASNYYGAQLLWRRRNLALGKWLENGMNVAFRSKPLTHPLALGESPYRQLGTWKNAATILEVPWSDEVPWIPTVRGTAPLHSKHGRTLAVHPGARTASKRWPADRFLRLLEQLCAEFPQWNFLLIDPPDSPPLAFSHPRVRRKRPASLTQLAASLADVDALLCNDTAASHLAAALGKPVVTLFGSGDPEWFSPFRNYSHAIATNVCPHRPCLDRCVMPSFVCLESISIEVVAQKMRDLLAGLIGNG